MLTETVELTLAHLGLGDLNEQTLLALFATAQAHRITAGRDISLREIVDKADRPLYPAYYVTHLTVPPTRRLEEFRLWERVSIGVDVRAFGGMLLDSTYVLGRSGEVADDPATWDLAGLPSMRGGNMFLVDGRAGEPQVSIPKAGLLAELPKLGAPPESMDRFRAVRGRGAVPGEIDGPLTPREPIRYSVLGGRDAAPGHDMMFARFVEIMDYAEHAVLAEHVWPPFPTGLLECRTVLERETYYFDNCRGGQVVRIDVRGQLEPCPPSLHGASAEIVSAGILSFAIAVYREETNALLAVSRARKLLAVPTARQSLLRDAERLLFHLGPKT